MHFPRTASAALVAASMLAAGLVVGPPAHAASWTTVRTLNGSVLQACAHQAWFAYTVRFRVDNRRGRSTHQVRAVRERDNIRMSLSAPSRRMSGTKSFRATARDRVVVTLAGTGRDSRRSTRVTVRVSQLARC